ncbi:MAG: PfkB family carbohydrate kinase [Vicinamibacterales bacterium]
MHIVCVGDCGVDRYVALGVERPGGITFNVAANARRSFPPDARITIVTAIGIDPEAELVERAIARVDPDACVTRLAGATPVQYIAIEPSGEKRFLKYDPGVLTELRIGPRERKIIAGSDLLVTTVFAQVEGLFDSVMAAPSAGLRVVDFTDLSDGDGVGLVSRYADRFDVGFFGLRADQTSLIDALETIAVARGRLFVVTLGPDGSLAVGGPRRVAARAVAVNRIADTTGAGDSFAAGFLAEYCASRDVRRSLERGAAEAARTIQHLGATANADRRD